MTIQVSESESSNPSAMQPASSIRTRGPSAARRERMSQSFADIAAVLMRDPGFKNLRLADMEWLVLPAIMSGQWCIARSAVDQSIVNNKEPDDKDPIIIPTAVALWASVSPDIDERLSTSLQKPLLLKSHEWASGDQIWLVAIAGNNQVIPAFLKKLEATYFKGKQVKMRVNGPDGDVTIRTLNPAH